MRQLAEYEMVQIGDVIRYGSHTYSADCLAGQRVNELQPVDGGGYPVVVRLTDKDRQLEAIRKKLGL